MADPKRKYYETADFKALQKKWYGKLEDDGFQDAEREDGALQNWSTQFSRGNLEFNQSKEEYFRLAGHFLHDHRFANETERRVWELHTNGMSTGKIAKALPRGVDTDLDPRNTTGGYPTRIKKVQATIRGLAKQMVDECQKKR